MNHEVKQSQNGVLPNISYCFSLTLISNGSVVFMNPVAKPRWGQSNSFSNGSV